MPGYLTAIPSAIVGRPGGIVRGFHPDQADGRIDGFGCDSDTSHQTAAADGYDDRVDIRLCQHHFQADGALASNDVWIVIGMDLGETVTGNQIVGQANQIAKLRSCLDDGCAEALRASHFGERRAGGHGDGGRNAQAARVIGDALGMIAGGDGDHAAAALVFRQLQQAVECAPILERGGELQVLQRQPNLRAGEGG